MSYQVIARKWRPQKFDDVVGQQAVTRTLKNALASGRLAQAFVFAGPRGVGKTTTARILARALNCEKGPTADPCGTCESCVEIAEGRDMDVLEIDAATNTKVETVREVIISGLGMLPVRDRFKIFIIDEVHQLSAHSFNALLKSIEEPPPHVAFMMATTALEKIPDTVISRSHVFEFRQISARAIAAQLRKIADAERIAVADEALALIARAADGSMRDAETALDQVRAFAGDTISTDDVSTVLGLVGRDLVIEMVTAVADEEASAAFELAGRAVEAGYDLRMVCRELARMARDLLVIGVDPSRVDDPEIAPEGDRDRLKALAVRFSREDLLRAFDLLARAESDIRNAPEPRFHLEMVLLRWMHVRKLIPLTRLIESLETDGRVGLPEPRRGAGAAGALGLSPGGSQPPIRPAPARSAARESQPAAPSRVPEPSAGAPPSSAAPREPAVPAGAIEPAREAFLAEIKRTKAVFFGTVVAQAQRIEFDADTIVFTFSPTHRLLGEQVQQNKAWLEAIAERIAGRRLAVIAQSAAAAPIRSAEKPGEEPQGPAGAEPPDLKAIARADPTIQALLDVFPSEIRAVEDLTGRTESAAQVRQKNPS
jgi:DNA polymerase-3 subunit gamma/tau